MEIASPMHWRSVAARPCCSRETTSPRPTSIDAAKQRSDSCDNDRQRLGGWSARGRRGRDAIVSGRNNPVRGESPLGAGGGALVGVLAIERKDMQAAGKTRAAHIHHHVVETERLIGLAAQLLELV